MGDNLKAILDKVAKLLAVLTVLLYVFLILNGIFSFLTNSTVIEVLNIVRNYAALCVVGVVCLEWVADKGLIPFILVAALFGIIIISMFFPEIQNQLVKSLGK